MTYQNVFRRYEIKYLVTRKQKERILRGMSPFMKDDAYAKSSIRNIYFDTDDHRLIRRSLDKPKYKEKLRVRSYGEAALDSPVFVELKKKYDDVVYKRRLEMPELSALNWVCGKEKLHAPSQIADEIDYFISFYEALRPAMFLSYEREAYVSLDGSDFRVTFDDLIMAREEDISLESACYGTLLLPEDFVLMELKCHGGIPMWMTHILSSEKIYKTSFSKYGEAYRILVLEDQKHIDSTAGCHPRTFDVRFVTGKKSKHIKASCVLL